MKLVKLTIQDKFRSLFKGFTLDFREEKPDDSWTEFHPYCFAGLNGSGKSNVLEALANIFYHLECCTLNSEYSPFLKNGFDRIKSDPISYELEYYIIPKDSKKKSITDYINVIIRKESHSAPRIKIKAQDEQGNQKFEELTISIRRYLPELVIGYSSGENEILSLPFIKSRLLQLDEYLYHLRNKDIIKLDYDLEVKPESSLIYMDYHMSQAILLSNFLLQAEDILKPIKAQLDIDKLHSFRVVINNHKLYFEEDDPTLEYLLPLVKQTIDKLRSCSTVNYIQKNDNGNEGFEILDFFVNPATKKAFQDCFKTPIQLFKAFQVLSLLNLRVVDKTLKEEIYKSDSLYAMYKIPSFKESEHVFHFNLFKIKKNGSSDEMLLKAFSDGEHQFLHTMGICLMLQDKNTLLLLDEPETHFNPEWRSEFITLLKNCLNMSGTNHLMRDVILTSHSPFIISDCFPDKVVVFKKGEQPKTAFNKNFRTYGTSVDLIMEHIFNRNNTIGDLSRKVIEDIEKEIKDKTNLSEEEVKYYKDKTSELGDSMEKVLLFTKLNSLKKKYYAQDI